MEALEAILSRRSIRRYRSKPVPEKTVSELLRAAMSAPSANNLQPWHFVVVDDRAVLDAIQEFHPYSKMLSEAPLAILVCGDSRAEDKQSYMIQDCSAATQNLLLAAHAKDLGAVWLGIHPRQGRVEGCRKLFDLPDHILPLALIAVGHPAESKPRADRFDPSRVRRNRWGG